MAKLDKNTAAGVSPSVASYTEDQIDVVTNLKHIRMRPTGYIASKDNAGMVHLFGELVNNSLDELVIKPEGGYIHIVLCRDIGKHKFQLVITDDGRGIPYGKLLEAVTVLGTSGKLGNKLSYRISGGMYGYGAKVAPALSTRYRNISANNTEQIVGTVILKDGEVQEHYSEGIIAPYGVSIVVELDLSFFDNGTEFMSSGYLDLVRLCKQLNVFNEKVNFEISVIDRLLPETFWKCDIQTALNILEDIKKDPYRTVEYSASSVIDKSAYLFEVWKLNSAIVSTTILKKDPVSFKDRLSFDIKMYFSKKSASGNPQYFITVNNINLPDVTGNSATQVYLSVLRNKLVPYMADDRHKKFLLEEYRFPTLMLALGICYQGAELSGITKTSFKDGVFAKQFSTELNKLFESQGKEYWDTLALVLKQDIELRYSQFYDTPQKKSEGRKVFADLNFPKNYYECKSSNPEECELYIVEGTSAGNITDTRDANYQAVYTTRGKPYNAATMLENLAVNRKKLQADPIYSDLLKILNISANTTDMSTARYRKLIIATDADPDGYHIGAIHLNNLYIINPKILESGMVYIANPPLYSMNIAKNKKMFLRDKNALMDARIEYLYRPTLQLRLTTSAGQMDIKKNLYAEICYLIESIGDLCTIAANQLNIPLLVLERLIFAIDSIYPKLDYLALAKYFESSDPLGYIRVQSNEIGRYIVVSVGPEDFPIGLDKIADIIVGHLLPTLKKYKFYDLGFEMRSKHKGSDFNNWTPVSMLMLYICMKQLDQMFKVSRYKGLGELVTEDCYQLLMDPNTRSLTQVTGPGDPKYNYQLLGNDSGERKKLLTDSTVLSHTFRREHSSWT